MINVLVNINLNRRMAEILTEVNGHRGCRGKKGVAENSLAAFEVSLKKVDGVELDVFLTTDNHLVVFHDETLEKLSDGAGPITSHSLDQLKQLKLREQSESNVFTNDNIPTLDEVLDMVQKARAAHPQDKRLQNFKVRVEIKGLGIANEVAKTIEERLNKKESDWRIANFEIRSFDMSSLNEMKKRMPEMQLGVLFAGPEHPWDISEQELDRLLQANKNLFEESAKPKPNNTVSITLDSLTDKAIEMINNIVGIDPDDSKPRVTPWTAGERNPTTLPPDDQRKLVGMLKRVVSRSGAFISDFPEEMKDIIASYSGHDALLAAGVARSAQSSV